MVSEWFATFLASDAFLIAISLCVATAIMLLYLGVFDPPCDDG